MIGCLFFWPLLGLDPLPGRWPYPARALLMFLSAPFHTVLGLTVMQSTTLLGGDWYPSLGPDLGRPVRRPVVAGGILWAGGEFVSVTMLACWSCSGSSSPSGRPAGSTASWTARRPASGRRPRRRRADGRGRRPGGTSARHVDRYDQRPATRWKPATDERASVHRPALQRRPAGPRPDAAGHRHPPGGRPAGRVRRRVDLRRGASGWSTTTRSTCCVLDGEASPGRRPRHRPPDQGRGRRRRRRPAW